jgi:hypothetical protein
MKKALFLMLALALNHHSAAIAAEDEVFTADEAAAFLKINHVEVQRLFTKKEIPGREIGGGDLRISKRALLLWLEKEGEETTQVASSAPDQPGKEKSGAAVTEDQEETDIEVIALRDRAAINKSGQMSGEVGLAYAKQQRYALIQDEMVNIEQRAVTSALTLRYGFGNDNQIRLSTPYQFNSDEVLLNGSQLFEESESQYGPTVLGLQKVLLEEGAGYPGILCGLGVGIGHEAEANASCTFSKTYDPAILYASLQYAFPLTNDTSSNVNGNLGVGLKINEEIMLKGDVLGRYIADKDTIEGREDFGLSFGLNWRVHKHIYLEPSIESYLTAEGSEFTVGVNLIYEP